MSRPTYSLRPLALGLAVALGLSACGGGGGGGYVRPSSPPAPPPPAPPPPPPPPAPPPPATQPALPVGFITATVDVPEGAKWSYTDISGGTLVKAGPGVLLLSGKNTLTGSLDVQGGWSDLLLDIAGRPGSLSGNVDITGTGSFYLVSSNLTGDTDAWDQGHFEASMGALQDGQPGGQSTIVGDIHAHHHGDIRLFNGTLLQGNAFTYDDSFFWLGGSSIEGNVTTKDDSAFWLLSGLITGDVSILGTSDFHLKSAPGKPAVIGNIGVGQGAHFLLDATVDGDVVNAGTLWAHDTGYEFDDLPDYYNNGGEYFFGHSWIGGNYVQTVDGMLKLSFGADLRVTGSATLAGALYIYDINAFRPDGNSDVILHADGGISGTFGTFTMESVLVGGNLSYQPNDVVFNVTQVPAASAMSAAGADAMTLGGADLLDRAFGSANGLAAMPYSSLSDAQRRFLASAGSLQWIGDIGQLRASLDSLSGQTYAAGQSRLLAQLGTVSSREIGQRYAGPSIGVTGYWSNPGTASSAPVSGYDFSPLPNWMVGGSVFRGNGQMQSAREGARAFGPTAGAQLYARWRNDNGSYLAGVLGYGGQRLRTDRRIDLGNGENHRAWSQRDLDLVDLHVEAGHPLSLGGGWLTPFVAVDAASLRGDAFVEQGDTGFELLAQPSHATPASAGFGARYARNWRFGDRGWLRLALDGGYDWSHGSDGSLRAAFVGAPDAWFDIDGLPRAGRSWIGLGLAGGGERWSWRLDGFQDSRIDRGSQWAFGLVRAF